MAGRSQLFEALLPLVRESVYLNLERAADVQELFPPGFHADLGKLLGRLVSKLVPGWRQSALVNQVSPPKLVDVDWRVDLQTSSNLLARMSVPSVLVEMKVCFPPAPPSDGTAPASTDQPGIACTFPDCPARPQIQEVPQDQGVVPDIQTVQFELSKPALGTMLHGLEKVGFACF